MKRRLLSALLAAMMLLTMLPAGALADDESDTASASVRAIYLDQYNGSDENDGLTAANAVQTINKANERADEEQLTDIYLNNQYKVSGDETWNLGGKTIHRYGIGGYMIALENASASLTLSNVVIDGAEVQENYLHDEHTESIIFALDGGTIALNNGAVLQNNHASQWGSAILASNGASVTMENGSTVRNNTNFNYECGTILVGNGSTFTMNGGVISGNTANSGGAVAIIGSSMVMNGGTISDNSVYRTSGQGSYGGAIYIADYAGASGLGGQPNLFTAAPASFEMNGGTISGNTALDYGGAITTSPQRGKTVTVTINDGEISENKATENRGGAIAAFFNLTHLTINGGKITNNTAKSYGGGIYLYDVSDAQLSGGIISENEAAYGGGIGLLSSSFMQTGGTIEKNTASWGGGVYGGNYTMTGGIITDNNSSLTREERESTRGDGVCVGPSFNLGDDAIINTNNDVYLRKGSTVSKEGCYINVISPCSNLSTDAPIEITSQDITIDNNGVIGTQLVFYTDAAGGTTAAQQADADGLFVPSWKMSGVLIGQSSQADKTDWLTYVPAVKVEYQWVSTDNPSDVSKPQTAYIRPGSAFTAAKQENTAQHYLFDGWYTDEQCTQAYTDGTVLNSDTTLYGRWKPTVTITPMDITVYVGGDGYNGVIGEDGKFSTNDLPEIGFYLTLPDSVNAMLGGTADAPVDLSGKLAMTYADANGTTRSWSLKLYGDETMSQVTMNGRRVYIYKLLPSQIDGTEETVPLRMQFTDAAGKVLTGSKFPVNENDQYRNYKVNFYPGVLDTKLFRAEITVNGATTAYPIILGTGNLRVRENADETYRDIQENTTPAVNQQDKDIFLAATAQTGTQYYLNQTGISADPTNVKLLVDHSMDDALLRAYIEQTSNTEGKYTYQFRYLDLVDTSNGNAYVTMGAGQKMDIYWPVPSDAKPDTEFHIVHFQGLDRDADVDMDDLWTTHIPEEMTGTKITVDGREFVKFTVGSFSPFALLYEKAAPSGGGSSGSGESSSSSKYILHYESNGGTSYKDESYSSGTTVTLDKAPTRESYTFTGWYADKALTDKISSIKMTSNKTVYAGWTATDVPDMLNGDDHYAYVVGYSDGTVRPNANISRAEVATIFFRLLKEKVRDSNLTTENTFADVTNGQWHNKAISTMAKLGVVKGRNAEAFDPDAPITRAEFATICARFDKTQINTDSNFTDISGHWAETYIERAATLGWIAGYSDGTFRPNNYITRAEAMTMINRVLRRMPQSADDLLNDMTVWPDNKPTDWHYLAVQEATNSHDFDRKGEVNEKWTKLTTAPDWTRYQ